jgi:hypothetical protein
MTIVVSPSAQAVWPITSRRIAEDALEHLEVKAAGTTVSADDLALAIRKLDGILKELPIYGLSWPRLIAGESSLTWNSTIPGKVTLPGDYFSDPVLFITTDTGEERQLTMLLPAEWNAITDQNKADKYPEFAFLDSDNTLYFYPVPTQNPQAKVKYQQLQADIDYTTTLAVKQSWILALGYGVAYEMANAFGKSLQEKADLGNDWALRRALLIAHEIPAGDIAFEVDD